MNILFCIENRVLYKYFNTKNVTEEQLKKYLPHNMTHVHMNHTQSELEHYAEWLNTEHKPYRYLMFGGGVVFPLDILIILIGTYMSSIVFIVSLLSMRALAASYEKFNKEVKSLKDRHQLNNFHEILRIEERFMDYNKLAKHIYFTDGTFISMTIMKGLIIHMSAQWGMRAYSEGMPWLQMIVMINWTVLGMIMFIPFMLRPMEYYINTTNTVEILLEEKSILGEAEMQISYILDRIIMKVERADYAKYLCLLFVIMFGVDIMAAYWKKMN